MTDNDPKTITWAEAIRQTDETTKRLKAEIEKGREAEANYWRGVFGEDRIEALETAISEALKELDQIHFDLETNHIRRILEGALGGDA